ncbi:MAG: PQQ-binding-like beta-propeller repeat protein [Bryobacteraceae bacterium]
MNRRTFLSIIFSCAGASAEDWPQFRGPDGQGHSSEVGLPLEWSESEHVAWKTSVPGAGWSSPAVGGNRIWLTTATESGRSLRAIAVDVNSGSTMIDTEVFRLTGDIPIHAKNSHASPTPVVDGNHVFLHFGSYGTACINESGEVVWRTRLRYYHRHGPGGSPALYRDLLIISCDGYDIQYVVALDKKTGKIRWKSSRDGYQAYTTPLVIHVDGRDQVVSPGAYRSVAYNPMTGAEIWSVGYGKGYSNVPRPVFGGGLVFLCTDFEQPSIIAVRPDGKGDVTETHVAWTVSRGAPLTPSPLLVADELYFVSDNGIASCVDARTGKEHWRHRLGGSYSASPIYADGRIYFMSEECECVAIAPGTRFRELARNRLDGMCLASMAVSDGALFIRTSEHLYRVDSLVSARSSSH